MKQTIILITLFFSLLIGAYFFGASRQKIKTITKEVEVVKYVEKKKSEIYSQPNASRSELLKLMYSGKL